jgi:hypothetical protein
MAEVTDERMAAFNARMEERRKRETAEVVPEETPEDLQRAYLARTGRKEMRSGGDLSGKTIVINRRTGS